MERMTIQLLTRNKNINGIMIIETTNAVLLGRRTCTESICVRICLLRDEATMHFDIVLNFLATRKMCGVCGSCTILRVEEVVVDDGNYSGTVLPQQQDEYVAICVLMCAMCYNGKAKAVKLPKKCYKYQVLSFTSHLFCRRRCFVFRSWCFFSLQFLLLLPPPFCLLYGFSVPIFNVVFTTLIQF